MADFCLKKIASDNKTEATQNTIDIVNQSFYVNDGLVSCRNIADGNNTMCELVKLLDSSGFEVRKFISNFPEIFSDIDTDRLLNDGNNVDLLNDENNPHKTLGLQWHLNTDALMI